MKITDNRYFKILITAVFWLALWQAVCVIVGRDVLIASPADTFNALIEMLQTTVFYKTIAMSFVRVACGFFIGMAVGIIAAVITCANKTIYMLLKPAINIIKSTPVASFIIIALAWMKSGQVPVFISFIATAPIVWGNVSEGIKSVDVKILEMAKIFEYSFSVKLKKIYIPSIMPFMRSAIISGAGFAWKSGVAAEVIGSPEYALGSKLYDAKVYLETPQLFAWTAVIIILSIIFEKIVIRLVNAAECKKETKNEKTCF